MTSSLTRLLSGVLCSPVDPDTCERAQLHLLDWLGCAVIGATEPAGQILRQLAGDAPAGALPVIGGPGVAAADTAVFVNGGLGNILEMDDIHRGAILHPGPVVIPAALVASQVRRAPPAAFLAAIVRGYEADIRIGCAVGPGHYAKWHNTATCGPFAAAAAVASLFELSQDQVVWALGNAGTQASGPWRCRHEAVMTKQLHTARAAQAGYCAADLAARGFTGPEFILEGEQGFFDAMCPDPDPDGIGAPLDGPWRIWETSFKPWPACRHTHAAIDAALLLGPRVAANLPDIRAIRILTYGDAATFCDRAEPTTPHEAKFSLQHAVALALSDGEPDLSGFARIVIDRPDIARLRAVSIVEIDSRFDGPYPARFGSAVEIDLASGETLQECVPDALGDPENPLSADRIIAKAKNLMAAAGVSDNSILAVVTTALDLASGRPVSDLVAALAPLQNQINEARTA